MSLCDLHVHSTASDGRLTPAGLVNEAAAAGLEAFALADHDTLDGIPEASSRASELGLMYIPAVELSVDLHSGGSAHMLGYFPGVATGTLMDPGSELMLALDNIIRGRSERNPEIVKRFQEMGFSISMEEVEAEAGGSVVGRPHIAAVLVRKGLVQSSEEVFNRYLAAGKPAYVERRRLGDYRAMAIIRQAGGLPVLAHPAYVPAEDRRGLVSIIASLADGGLAGLEAYYPEHDTALVELLEKTAASRKLLLTGGSDFHGIKEPIPGWTEGRYGVDCDKVSAFLELCRERMGYGEAQ